MFWGGIVIMLGNFILAIPATPPVFYLGLRVIVVGVGLFKPNISAIVGELYDRQATRAATPASPSSTWASTSARSSRR